jgi:predicted secreted hydrolase
VSGLSWLDHQWGNWSWSGTLGWTWMALQLDNGIQMSIFDVRGFATPILFASVLGKNGVTTKVPNVTVTGTGAWRSPHTGTVYPSGWVVRIPSLGATFRIAPTVKDQEVVSPNQPVASYWEGSGRITGRYRGKPVTGLSYTELTGYAKR